MVSPTQTTRSNESAPELSQLISTVVAGRLQSIVGVAGMVDVVAVVVGATVVTAVVATLVTLAGRLVGTACDSDCETRNSTHG